MRILLVTVCLALCLQFDIYVKAGSHVCFVNSGLGSIACWDDRIPQG